MSKSFVLHDESVNTYGFRLLTSGCNLEEFQRNPVMLLNHDDFSLPIGRWENIRVEDGRILADPVFDLDDPKGKMVADKVAGGFIRMASIGTWPPEAASDDPGLKLAGQVGPTITRWTLREASIVTIGANHNALAFYDRGTGQRINLGDAELVHLMDLCLPSATPNPNNDMDMNKDLNKMLGLKDEASEEEQLGAIEQLQERIKELVKELETLREEKRLLEEAEEKRAQEEQEKKQGEAARLVDEAVSDGRLDASSKETFLSLFDSDYEAAKKALEGLPRHQPIADKLEDKQPSEGAWAKRMQDIRSRSPR